MQSSASINLVKRKTNLLDEILRWSLSVGRLLVIITEIVAFTTFIYRFSLDRTLIDLHTSIKDKQAIIESLKDREAIYRNLQERIIVASTISARNDKNVTLINDVVEKTPQGITFNLLTIDETGVIIDANINSVSSLMAFINSLREYPKFDSVTIEAIDNKSSNSSVIVRISAKLKEDLK